jgi:hypothetical protein
MHIVLRIFTLCALCALLSGCHRQGYFFRKKLYFNFQPTAIERTLDGRTNQTPLPSPYPSAPQHNEILQSPTFTIWIHGAQPFKANTYNLGLKSLDSFGHEDHFTKIATTLHYGDPHRFPRDQIYFFSWSGKMGFTERKRAANKLYRQLTALIKNYQQQHQIQPKIEIIAHSHGGNVALNLANIKGNHLPIERLVLLACPVQEKTAVLMRSPLFKKIFSLYSTLDIAQVIDPQGLYHNGDCASLFSHQRFEPQPNLLQVKVRINGHSFLHHEFHNFPFVTLLPKILDQLDTWFAESQPEIILSDQACFVLSIYTNGRMPPRHRQHHSKPHEHVVIPFP